MQNKLSFSTQNPFSSCVIFLLLFLWGSSFSGNAQSLQWVNPVLGNTTITTVSLASDNALNNYQTGSFYSLVDFDAGPGIDTINASKYSGNPTAYAAYASKISNAGNHIWAKAFIPNNNNSRAEGRAIDADGNSNLFVLGRFRGTVDFDPGAALNTITTNWNSYIPYIVKLNNSGNYLWARKIDISIQGGTSVAYAMKTGVNNDIYIYGSFTGTVDFDPGPGINNFTALTVSNYVLKLDSNGDFVWLKTWDNASNNTNTFGNRTLDIDANDNLYVCMSYSSIDTLDLDPGPVVNNVIGKNFLIKIDASGNFVWGGGCTANSLQVHLDNFGHIYTTGAFSAGADIDPGPGSYITNDPGNIFIGKSDLAGNFIWAKKIKAGTVYHLTTDTAGNIFNAWWFNGQSVDCDPDTSKYMIYSNGSNYLFCALDSSGNFLWAKRLNWNNVWNSLGVYLNVNAANDLMIAARFCFTVDVDFGPAVYNVGQGGALNSLLMKYNYCGTTNNLFYAGCDSVVLPDTTYLVSKDYVKEYLDVFNCDSNVNIHVTVLPQQNDYTLNGCDTVNYNGQIYSQSGTYIQIVPNGIGCDSVHTLHVNINTPVGLPPFLNQIQTFQPVYPPLPSLLYTTSYNIEIDSFYNMYISGKFSEEIDFNPLGIPYIDTSFYPGYGFPDGFVTRYDSSGMLTWMHKIQTNDPMGAEHTPALCLNDNLDLFSVTVAPGSIFGMNRLNQFSYANTWFGTSSMGVAYWNVNQVLNDPTSNEVVKIGFYDSIYGPMETKKLLYVARGNNAVTFSTGGNYIGYEGAVDQQGNIYVLSNMQPIDQGNTYYMIAKLDANLNMLWNKQLGIQGNPWGPDPSRMEVTQLKAEPNGTLLLCGRFVQTWDIDISPNTYNLVSKGGWDAFIARFDTSANLIWANAFGGTDDDVASSLTTDLSGKIYLGGTFGSPSIDLDPSAGITFLMKNCVNANWQGGYISKFKPDGTFMKGMGSGTVINELEFKAPKRIYAVGHPFVQVFEMDYDTTVFMTTEICDGDTLVVGNNIYTQSGVYTDTLMSYLGSDSIVITTLTVNPNSFSNTNISICANQTPYLWNGQNFNSSGIYTVNLTNFYGCDSAATLNLNVSPCIVCVPNFTINYSPFYNSLTESQSWITTSGTVLILAGTNVKLDAHTNSYVRLNPGFKVEHGAVFVAQAYNGCTAGAPQLPQSGKVFNSESVASNEIVLYPNPTTGMIHIKHDEKLIGIQIFDMVGKLIINQQCDGETETNIDLSNLPNGIYHVKAAGYNSIKVVKND